ncbi:MAG: CinA family protein, partial [Planctomycetaceae bacterium]
EHEVLPHLPRGELVIRRRLINMFGVGESHAEQLLGDVTKRQRDPEVGITAHEGTISLRIVSHGTSAAECEAKIEATEREIRRLMGHYIFGVEEEELEDVVLTRLAERGQTLSTVEIGTGGLLAHRLTSLNAVSAEGKTSPYSGGTILTDGRSSDKHATASQAVWSRHLSGERGIDGLTTELARACRVQYETDYALAVAPFPQHDPDRDPLATPITYVALASRDQLQLQEIVLLGDPAIHKSRAAKTALNMLRLALQ